MDRRSFLVAGAALGVAPTLRAQAPAAPVGLDQGPILPALLAGVVSLADIESGVIYSAEDGGMLLVLTPE